ncbi:MAG TPA: penicillin-binding protein 2 [Burkholderiales bacterium]|nr:penicillin-binding protein 2 [Burkholderiales bacterium]
MRTTAEMRNSERELYQFHFRVGVAAVAIVAAFGLLAARFVVLQLVQHDTYSAKAEENRISILPIPPNRGLILDRNGVVMARNYSGYELEIKVRRVRNLDATIDEVAELIDVTPRDRARFKKLLAETRKPEGLPIRSRLNDEEVAKFAANRFRFDGVDIKPRLFRQYPYGDTASHLIGYMGRINQQDQESLEEAGVDANYRGTDYIGKMGLEATYQDDLHGVTGFERVEVDAAGRGIRTLPPRTPSKPGNNVALTIDLKLQQVAESAFGVRRGALVALEPSTGAVLAFVSKPGYDPNLFVDGIDPQSWTELNTSPDKPLVNRAINGVYPPGSTFKPFMAMAALETGKRTPRSTIQDHGFFEFGGRRFRDSKPGGNGTVDLMKSIVVSSDTYYYQLANDMGIDAIAAFMKNFGLGSRTGIDLQGEATGVLPSPEWKLKRFKDPRNQKWFPGETISIGIGQGYNAYTPIQLAVGLSTLLNGGTMYKPRLVAYIDNVREGTRQTFEPEVIHQASFKPEHVEFIKRAMQGVNKEGTGRWAFAGAPYTSGGKTGTAQVIAMKQNEKYDESKVSERLRDHSWFIAFAPVENPKIAMAIIVENGGFGARAAAPIARTVLDYFLLGKLPPAMKQAPEDNDADNREND